jgi:hypothetical protein
MPWPELPDTSDQMPAATQPPLDELSRARYRREANTRRREARSKANELRELGRIAAMMLQTRGLPPNQMIAEAEQGEGNAWLATLVDADEVATGPSAYLLFAGRIAMLDIQFIRDNPELVQEKSKQKGYKVDIRAAAGARYAAPHPADSGRGTARPPQHVIHESA